MKKPLVSVVMPAYNSEKYIAEAIESILNQTYKNFEFIIVHDGSTDKTLEIIQKYAKKDKRIRVIDNEKNIGNNRSRNKGIFASQGKYIATQDSDDISLLRRFKEQVDFLEKSQDVAVVGSDIELFNGETGEIISIRRYPETDQGLRKMIFFSSPFAQPATMIRKEAIIELGGYSGRFLVSEDLDMWFRIGTYYKFASIPSVLLRYRVHKNSLTGRKLKTMEKIANQLRWENASNKAYSFGFKAFIYNLLHRISIYLVPSKFKFWLFSKLRDKRK